MPRRKKEQCVKATTVRIHDDTINRLQLLRTHPRETPDDLINNAINKLDSIQTELAIIKSKIKARAINLEDE